MAKILLFQRNWFRSKSYFMRLIKLNMYAGKCAAPGNTWPLCPQLHLFLFHHLNVQHSNRFLAVPLFVRLKSKYSPPSSWKVGFMGTENDHNTPSVLKANIYIDHCLTFPFSPLPVCPGVQLTADWTPVRLVCCWSRDEAPTHWLTCSSSKVSPRPVLKKFHFHWNATGHC